MTTEPHLSQNDDRDPNQSVSASASAIAIDGADPPQLPLIPRPRSRFQAWLPWFVLIGILGILLLQFSSLVIALRQSRNLNGQAESLAELRTDVIDQSDRIGGIDRRVETLEQSTAKQPQQPDGLGTELRKVLTELRNLTDDENKQKNPASAGREVNPPSPNKPGADAANTTDAVNKPEENVRVDTSGLSEDAILKHINDLHSRHINTLTGVNKKIADLEQQLIIFSEQANSLRRKYFDERRGLSHDVCLLFFHAGKGTSPLICGEAVREFVKRNPYRDAGPYRMLVAIKEGTSATNEVLTFDEFESNDFVMLDDNLGKEQTPNSAARNQFDVAARELKSIFADTANGKKTAVWFVGQNAPPPNPMDDLGDIRLHVVQVIGNPTEYYDKDQREPMRLLGWLNFCRRHKGIFQIIMTKRENGNDGKSQTVSKTEVLHALQLTCRPESEVISSHETSDQ